MRAPLVLIDGSSYFFRAFHALPPLTNSKGRPTGAVYGVANMVKKLVKDYPKSQVIVVFDAKGKTFRHDWYPDYKSHRPPMADDLANQFQPLLSLIKAMGLPLLMVGGVEADDVIGTLTVLANKENSPVVISTGDKDLTQLVNENVILINTMTNQCYDIKKVKEKFGVLPSQIIDYLALIGDSIDNVPGIPKCGPKTAAKWLEQYQTMENIIADADSIPGKIGENLRDSIQFLPLSKKLVTIQTDVQLPFELHDLVTKDRDIEKLVALTQELEFKGWLKELLEESEKELKRQIPIKYTIINTLDKLDDLLTELSTSSLISLDVKTTSFDPLQSDIVGIALATVVNNPYYMAICGLGA